MAIKMNIRILLICIACLSLAACESLVTEIDEADLPKTESRLVVQSFISPENQKTLVVVSQSAPLFGQDIPAALVLSNALVTISNGSQEAVVPYDSVNMLYAIDKSRFPIEAGKKYTITASDGKRSVNSFCTVPLKVATPKSFEIDTTYSSNFANDTLLTLKMQWDDIPGERNFYRVRAYIDLEYSVADDTSPQDFKERRIRNRFNVNWEETVGRDNFQSDASLDGTVFTSPRGTLRLPGITAYDFGNGNVFTVYPKSKIVSVTMEVFNTDEVYYKYHKSLDNARNSDNPFVEPSLVFTNINGGLGCFAAYHIGQLIYRPE
ncbi:DUF4249 domain-containing protein [Dyadobacter sp. CY343]|uniref:DUF4249 domain-containing protein n=1 Tax=Dyadobacter sp. CY343 TaxID=2907299 RepID=UPI001F25CF18|nr:DUF4249 domain-containing protein [Dyadobacter sp. CY343]MCE7058768.1 DUF4249 domain-containing protein [Dyadobacter sp. CY343]